jgi:hypothetical protein
VKFQGPQTSHTWFVVLLLRGSRTSHWVEAPDAVSAITDVLTRRVDGDAVHEGFGEGDRRLVTKITSIVDTAHTAPVR